MKSTIYFLLLAAVLVINVGLSFYHAGIAKRNHDYLLSMMAFKAQGARYTYDDGVRDRADRDRVDAELMSRIEVLEKSKEHTQCFQ
jgi:hypothetical protein